MINKAKSLFLLESKINSDRVGLFIVILHLTGPVMVRGIWEVYNILENAVGAL
jgi:hypothetical protein